MATTPLSPPLSLRVRAALPSRSTNGLVAAGVLAIGVYFALPARAQDVLYLCFAALAVAAATAHATREGRLAGPWAWFALGLLGSAAGDAVSTWYELARNREPPAPSAADWCYLASYPLLAVGIALLVRRVGGRSLRLVAFDTLVVTAAAVLVQWVFFVSPYLHGSDTGAARVVDMAYPSLDVLLLVGVLQLIVGPTRKTTSYRLIVVAIALWVVGDEIYGLWSASYSAGDWMDTFWLGSYLAWAAAAVEPARVGPARDRRLRPRLSALRVAILGAALLTPPAVLVVERATGHAVNGYVVGAVSMALSVLVIGRFVGLLRAYERARREERLARQEAEQATRLMTAQNRELREVDRLKDEFVSSISHELRTPLTSISGYVDLLRELNDAPESEEYLGIVERNATRLLGLVDDLLFAARVQAGTLELEVAPVDVRALAEDAVASARPRAERSGVNLRPETSAVPPVRGDARRLAQVIDNLIANAIKFTPDGGDVDVVVSAADGYVRVDVRDTGIGMEAADVDRLFVRFYRASTARERQIAGTGLGLYISKAIVESHGGRIDVRSAPGAGSTFTVELPALA